MSRDQTTLTDETWGQLQEWVNDYDYIVPLPSEQLREHRGAIDAFDARGLRLMDRVRTEWRVDVRTGEELCIQYWSEELLRYLDPPGSGDSRPSVDQE